VSAPGTAAAAAAVTFAAAYVVVRIHTWATRTPSGKAAVGILRLARFLVVALAIGVAVVCVVAYQVARGGWRTALGGASAPERWRRGARRIDHRLADDPGTVPRHAGYTPTPSGGVYHVRLPEGRTWRDLEPDRVASAFGATSALVTPGATGERANVRVRTRDTLTTPRPAPPPTWSGPRVTIGWSEDDAPPRARPHHLPRRRRRRLPVGEEQRAAPARRALRREPGVRPLVARREGRRRARRVGVALLRVRQGGRRRRRPRRRAPRRRARPR
jgi:hypothetical protein